MDLKSVRHIYVVAESGNACCVSFRKKGEALALLCDWKCHPSDCDISEMTAFMENIMNAFGVSLETEVTRVDNGKHAQAMVDAFLNRKQ